MIDDALRAYIERACACSDGIVARAFRKALGIERRGRSEGAAAAKVDRYEGIAECFANRTPRPL